MGSRIMHAIIACKVADALMIQDQATFLVGGIAADAAITNKETSHFYTGELRHFTRKIDYEAFVEKYGSKAPESYIAGYYTHLIADDLWLQGFYVPWLKNRIELNPAVLQAYHEDFKLLNAKLIEYYRLNERLATLLKIPFEAGNLQEVPAEEISAFIPYVLADLKYDSAALHTSLTIFTLEQIIGYIETSVEKSVFLLKMKQKKLDEKEHER
ncbi:hydrolase [Solibacillus silvestris]|uniref:hydrolase n=1 Tax=Solibacillus silvestris TaxID=76853 RepID=UPI003F7FE510